MKSKQYVYVITIIFILSLIPLYIIGKYNHPSVDDYYYGVETAKVYRDTGSVSQVISTSFDEMKNTYNDWQGNFAAIFLMRLQPAVFRLCIIICYTYKRICCRHACIHI